MNGSNEDEYLAALAGLNEDGVTEELWLMLHDNLYRSTLNWPDNLPPIGRSNLVDGSLRKKFHETYRSMLSKHLHKVDNKTKSIKFL